MGKITVKLKYINSEYRIANFEHQIDLEKHKKAIDLEIGSKIKMGDFGTPNKEIFFGSDIFPHQFDRWEDHLTFHVENILN